LGEGQEVESELIIACSEPSAFFEPTDGPLDAASFAVRSPIEPFAAQPGLIGFARDHRLDAAAREELADGLVAVPLVAGDFAGPADVAWTMHVVELRGFVRLPRGDGDGEHKALSVSNHVEFGSPSAA